jgi:hypothetical protein
MTAVPVPRHLPDDVTVVEVDGSRFLLEWLDVEVLAAAAAGRSRTLPDGDESGPPGRS